MTTARKDFMQANISGTFHLIARCVRRSFLQDFDEYSGKDYSHRKSWVLYKTKLLLEAFAIDIASFANMDNHYHLVARNRPDLLKNLTPQEIATRWLKIHPTKEMKKDKRITPTKDDIDQTLIEYDAEELRSRLSDFSWFMRELNQYIAVRANGEDNCKGSFFESRFKSQNLADDAAILTCMIYCDLNPIRAQIASSKEDSIHTSGYVRYQAEKAKNNLVNADNLNEIQPNKKLDILQKNENKEQKEISIINEWLAPIEYSVVSS